MSQPTAVLAALVLLLEGCAYHRLVVAEPSPGDQTYHPVSSSALGWGAMISIGSIYYLIPRLFGQEKMYSIPAISLHFWMSTLGVVLYIASMWIAGVMQGLMWRAINDDGTLTYTFVESVKDSYPFWTIRFVGGLLFLSGMFVMAWNVWKTIAGQKPYNAPVVAPAAAHA
jgi:cytochrome c oxidase cbb3-type subunit 1